MRYDRRGFLGLAAVAAAMLAGCGGGNTGGEIGPPGVYPLSATLRAYQVGDVWNYTLRVTRSGGSGSSVPGNGIAGIIARQAAQPTVAFQSMYDYEGGGRSYSSSFRQDADTKDLLQFSSRKGYRIDPPAVVVPGTWSRDVAFTRTLTDSANNTEQVSLAVIGTERVTVPAGTFETWKTTISENNSMQESSGTYWYAPQIGQYVKAVYDITLKSPYGTGTSSTYDMQLTYTNVPLGG